jgi:amino acid transporter
VTRMGAASSEPHAALRTHALSVRTLFLVVFILVSAGPFGIEEMVSSSGPGVAILLLLLVPLVWGAPLALVCTELASAIPDEGGPYPWVERGLGRTAAFLSGWWLTLSGTVDTALYVVLAVSYANTWLGQPPLVQWLMSVAIIAIFAGLNVRSLRSMALSSAAFAVLILIPCAALTLLGLINWRQNPFVPLHPEGTTLLGSMGAGLAVALWFYSGYESVSTMAGEIAEPRRVIPRALLLSIPAVVAVYLLPTVAALASVGRWSEWSEEGITLVQVAQELGGPLLGVPMMAAALVSSLALYNAYLASGARTTLVMAQQGMLPRAFGLIHPRFGTPYGSILIAAALHALLAVGSFEALLVIDVLLFVLTYFLIFAAFFALRLREPELERPYRVPVGTGGAFLVALIPSMVGVVMLATIGREYLFWGALVAATGPLAYRALERRRLGGGPTEPIGG